MVASKTHPCFESQFVFSFNMTMATTIQQIDTWRAARSEHQRLEFKEAKAQFDNRKLYKYCVALANEGGGHLLLGIEDKLPRKVVGTTSFNDPVKMAAKLFQALGFLVEIEEVMHPDGRVLVFHIPGRPLGTVYDFEGAYLMRAGEELVPMNEDRLRTIFAEGQPDWLSQPALTDCDDDKVVLLLDTQSYFDLLHLPYPVNRAGVLERFESEKLIQREDAGWSITNLGGMLFAKKLEQFDRLARKAARVIVYEGTNKLKTKLDRSGSRGYAVGFQGLVEFINGLVPSNEVIEQALRREVKMFPEIAVRELVANASIHQDFEDMDRNDRVLATYQHSCLRYVMNEKMTNQSLRERFRLPEKKTESVSRAIRDTMDARKIKLADPEQTSLRYRPMCPFGLDFHLEANRCKMPSMT